jgi:hypothetical protein
MFFIVMRGGKGCAKKPLKRREEKDEMTGGWEEV